MKELRKQVNPPALPGWTSDQMKELLAYLTRYRDQHGRLIRKSKTPGARQAEWWSEGMVKYHQNARAVLNQLRSYLRLQIRRREKEEELLGYRRPAQKG